MSTTQNLHRSQQELLRLTCSISCFYIKTTQKQTLSMHCFFLLLEFNRVLDNGIIIKDPRCHSHVSLSSGQIKTTGKQASYLSLSVRLCPQNPPCWRVRDTLRQDKQKAHQTFSKPVSGICLFGGQLPLVLRFLFRSLRAVDSWQV